MVQLKKVGVLSVAKVMALIYGAVGIVMVPVLLIVGATFMAAVPNGQKALGSIFLVQAMVFPFLYAGLGFLAGLLGGWLYNLIAGKVGGIEMEFSPVTLAVTSPLGVAMEPPTAV